MAKPNFHSRTAVKGGILVAVLAIASVSSADVARPLARFSYSAPVETNCPDESEIRRAVAARLGYDPFSPDAAHSISAVIAVQDHHQLKGQVELRDRTGRVTGTRSLASTRDCRELASAMELAISIAVDPKVLMAPRPVAPPSTSGSPERT